jgi:radical SAM superfamily enzyme YgiQ (UPF0313 family)
MDYTKIKNYSEKNIGSLDLSYQNRCLKDLLLKYPINYKRVAILNMPLQSPKILRKELVKKRGYSLYPPLGPLYIQSSIEQNTNWKVKLYDLQLLMLKNAGENIKYDLQTLIDEIDSNFDAYLFSCMFSTSQNTYKEISNIIRERNKPIIYGGVFSTGFSDMVLDGNCADIVIKHEGEKQIVNLLNYWEGHEVPLRNILFKHSNKTLSFPMLFEKIDPPNIIPQLKYIKEEIGNYNKYGYLGISSASFSENRISATILGNRGCRAACTFCSVHNFMGPKVRTTSEDTTIDTIKYLYEECGVRHIDWLDDDLVAYPEKSKKLFNRIADLNFDLVFTIQNAMLAINMDEELVDSIGRAGFVQVGFGVESGDEDMRKKIRRITRIENLKEVINLFRQKFPHIFIHCNFMIGLPGETVGQIKKTVDLALNLKLDWANLAVVQALPNTPMWDDFVKLNDPRIHTPNKYSPATATKEKGVSIDELGFEIVDIDELPADKVLNFKELNDIWYPINTRVNFLSNYNLQNHETIWKLKKYLSVLHKIFPLDPTIHLVLAKCLHIEGGKKNAKMAEKYLNLAEKEISEKKFWPLLLDHCRKYDLHQAIPI